MNRISVLAACAVTTLAAGGVVACKKQGGDSSGRTDVMVGEVSPEDMMAVARSGDARPGDWTAAVLNVTFATGAPTPSCTGASEAQRVDTNRAGFTYDRANKTLSGKWTCAPAASMGVNEEDMARLDATLMLATFRKRTDQPCSAASGLGLWKINRDGGGQTAYTEGDDGCGADQVIEGYQAFAESAWGRLEGR